MTTIRFLAGVLCGAALLNGSGPPARGQGSDWTEPFPPHRIAGNLYYVGSKDLASYLVATPEGHLLINSSLVESVPLIRSSVEGLGFRFGDVKILLISHAHSDHCAGSAEILRLTGARHFVMAEDADAVENGGPRRSRLLAGYLQFPPAKVDRRLRDGEAVSLGGSTLTAHLTPGHTPGCTTWAMTVKDDAGRALRAVIIGSPNVNPGYVLVDNPDYPGIADDYGKTFRFLKAQPVDLFLGAHGAYYGLVEKHARLGADPGSDPNPFIDPEGYRRYVADREQAFLAEWNRQKAGKP